MQTPSELLPYRGPIVPFAYIGDSHAGAIGWHLFEDPRGGPHITTNVVPIWRFVAADALDEQGRIGESLITALRRSGAFRTVLDAPQLAGFPSAMITYGREKKAEHYVLNAAANDAPYVLCIGEINTRYLLHWLVQDGIDFDLPFPAPELDALDASYPVRARFRADQMMKVLAEEFAPLFRALRMLREAGLKSLFLHSIPPPAVDDADAERVLKHPSPVRLRYKLARYVNFLYANVCRELGVGFIDMWPLVTKDGVLDPAFYLDGLHLNIEHSKRSVSEVYRQLAALRAGYPQEPAGTAQP